MERRFANRAISRDLARIRIPNLVAFLSHFRLSEEGLDRLTGSGPVNSAGHQRLEFAAPRSFFSGEDSFLLDEADPLIRGYTGVTDLPRDRYLAYRREQGRPVTRETFRAAMLYAATMGGYGSELANSIGARALASGSEAD